MLTDETERTIVLFITLVKLRRKITKEDIEGLDKALKEPKPMVKIHSIHYTLGRYDAVVYAEAPDEKTALAFYFDFADAASTETLVAVPREEALKAVGLR